MSQTLEQRVREAWHQDDTGDLAAALFHRELIGPLLAEWLDACDGAKGNLRTLQRIDLRFARLADAEVARRGG